MSIKRAILVTVLSISTYSVVGFAEPMSHDLKSLQYDYAQHPVIQALVSKAAALPRGNTKSKKQCYQYTRDALYRTGITDEFGGRCAREGVDTLKARGFVNLLEMPEYAKQIQGAWDAPIGAVLVYDGGGTIIGGYPCGHTEIRIDPSSGYNFVSDFLSANPVTGETNALSGMSFRLKGVMVKPEFMDSSTHEMQPVE